jgi:hypothetical protein
MDAHSGLRFEAMTTGVLLDRAFRLYKANFALMLGITAVAYVPFELARLLVESAFDINSQVSNNVVAALLYFFLFIILWSSLAFPIAGGAASYAISERYLGNEVTVMGALRRAVHCFWTLAHAELAATIRMIFGWLLLLVPGFLWLLSYTLIVPVIVVEKRSALASLDRSRDLMAGHRAKALCVLLVVILLHCRRHGAGNGRRLDFPCGNGGRNAPPAGVERLGIDSDHAPIRDRDDPALLRYAHPQGRLRSRNAQQSIHG